MTRSRNRIPCWSFVLLGAVGAQIACGNARNGGDGEGDATGLGGPDVPLAAVTEDVYTVGAIDGEDWETFSNISSVWFDAAGNLHVFDPGAHRVVVVGPSGGFVRTVGRQGEGPGEISNPMSAALLLDGRLAVFEFGMPGAFELFDPDGTHLETVTVDITKAMPGRELVPLPGGRLLTAGGGRMRIAGPGSSPDDEEEDEPAEDRRPLDVFSLDGSDPQLLYEAWDLPPAGAGEEASAVDAGGQRQIMFRMERTRAFEPGLHFDALSDGRVALADSTGWRIKLVAPDGSVDETLERPVEPVRVTASLQEEERRRRSAEMEEGGASRIQVIGSAVDVSQGLLDAMRRGVEDMIFADEVPVIANVAVDLDDRIWVARSGPLGQDDGPTDIVTPAGGYVGTLSPDGLRIPGAFGVGGLMAYVESDELGVQTVRVIRLLSLDR